MQRNRLPQAENYVHRNHNRRIWKRLVGALACVVVFCTTYALILPAITLEKQCPLEEHTHAESCYEQVPGHTHTEACYTTQRVLTCGLAETDAHVHETECYESQLVCDQEVSETHTHTETCYASVLVCAVSETDGHRHTENCYEQQPVLTCGLEETPDTQVLICGKEEHVHSAACTQDDSADEGIMLLSDDSSSLPVTKLSGEGTKYDPKTDLFTTKVCIDFQFTEKPTAGTAYTYTYPKGIVVPDDVVNKAPQKLMDGDKDAGTYQFVKNKDGTYSVQVIFDQEYIGGSGNTVTGYVQFEGSFSKEDMNEKGDIVVGGANAVVLVPGKDIAYPKDETESYNIDVSKSGSWVQDGDKLVYTVYVRTTKGTPDPISFTDTITADGLTLGTPAVEVTKYVRHIYGEYSQSDATEGTAVSVTPTTSTGNTISMTLPSLSILTDRTHGDYDTAHTDYEFYIVTYTYPITAQTVAVVSPKNKVTVTAKDETKGQTVTDSAEITVNVNKDFSYTLDKYGQVASDKPGYIKWTVTVNNNEQDIAGAKLADEMLDLVEDTAKDIVIYPAEGATVTKDENGKITDITFTATENGVNKNKYTITYYTPVKESWDGTTVTNKAAFDPTPGDDGDEKEVTASVTVSGVQLNKWGQFNGATNKIDWTITVNAGNLDIAGATLTDEMFAALSETDFTIEPSTGYSFTKDTDGKITGITFTEVEDGKNTQSYTIKYSTAVTENENGTTSPVTNSATLSPGEGKEGTPIGSESTVKPDEIQLTKSGSYTWDKKISWTITVNASKLNIAGAVLTDEMFSRLTASDITIQKNGGTPDSSEYTVDVDENGKITSITFKATEENSVNTNQYTITYTTDEPQAWNDKTVHNQAKLTLDGKETPGTADVTVPGDGSVAKSVGTGTVSDDGTTMTIPWTVTLTIPKGGLPAGTTIVDDVTKNQWGNTNTNQWMTRSQITAWATNLTWTDNNGNPVGGTNTYNPPPEQVTFLASDGNTYTFKQINEYKAPAGEEGVNYEALTYTLFTIHFPEGLIPPEGATRLTFTYSTTVDLTKATTGGNKFYNDIQVGGKETGAEYTYYKPGVVKTDGNGSTVTTTVSNEGELTWKVKATVGEGNKKLTLIDTLPGGVTLSSLQLTGWGNLNMKLSVNGGVITGTDSTNQYMVSGSYLDNTITLEIVPQTKENAIQAGAEFTLIVTCTVNGAENQTETKTLTNTAKMELDGGKIGSSSQTQEWTYKKEEVVTKVVDKSGDWDNTNRIMDYTVILNPEGKDLLDGSDTLTLVDTMTYTNEIYLQWPFSGTYNIDAALIQSSVKLYTAVWDETQGKWVAGEPVTGWSWTYEAKTGENDWDKHNATNTITATGVPDGMPLMLQYAYRITSNVPDEQNGQKTSFDLKFSNTAKLEGTDYSGNNSSSDSKWEHSSDSAGVTTDKSYTFYKVEAGNYNVSLAGATFSVYKYDTSTSEYGTEPVKTYSTNVSGSFHITRQEKDASGNVTFYDTNTLYKVTETAPPDGYKLPDKVETFYFYFSSTEDTKHTLPAHLPSDAVDLSNEAKTVYVENIKNTTEITVEKKWKDANNNDVTATKGSTISLNLYQIASTTPPGGGSNNVVWSFVGDRSYESPKTGSLTGVSVGDKIKLSLNMNYSGYNWMNITWEGVSDGGGGWNGNTYEYTCIVTFDVISIKVNDTVGCLNSVTGEVLESSTPDPGEAGDGETTPTGELVETIKISSSDDWKHTFDNLPLSGTDESGNTVTYYYYVKEISVPNYTTSYENNGGITSGTITVTNTAVETPGYELPETGGPGTTLYSAGGLLLMAAAGRFLLHKRKKRRKEDSASS